MPNNASRGGRAAGSSTASAARLIQASSGSGTASPRVSAAGVTVEERHIRAGIHPGRISAFWLSLDLHPTWRPVLPPVPGLECPEGHQPEDHPCLDQVRLS